MRRRGREKTTIALFVVLVLVAGTAILALSLYVQPPKPILSAEEFQALERRYHTPVDSAHVFNQTLATWTPPEWWVALLADPKRLADREELARALDFAGKAQPGVLRAEVEAARAVADRLRELEAPPDANWRSIHLFTGLAVYCSEVEHDPDAALEYCIDSMCLDSTGDAWSRLPEFVLEREAPSAEAIRRAIDRLDALCAKPIDIRPWLTQVYYQLDKEVVYAPTPLRADVPDHVRGPQRISYLWYAFRIRQNRDSIHRYLQTHRDLLEERLAGPYPEARDWLRNSDHPFAGEDWVGYPHESRWKVRQLLARKGGIDTVRRGTIVLLAIALYRGAHGEPPSSLDALTPEFLDEVPDDSFSDKPFEYRLAGDDFLLYSAGSSRRGTVSRNHKGTGGAVIIHAPRVRSEE